MKIGFKTILAMAITSATLTVTPAAAGHKTSQNVVIMEESSFANGDLGHVHTSDDSVQYIACTSQGNQATCTARDKDGVTKSCSTTNAAMLAAVHSLSPESHLYFAWNSSGQCTVVKVKNSSVTRPK